MNPQINKAEVLRYLGYKGQALEFTMLERIDSAIDRCQKEITPRSIFEVFEISDREKAVAIYPHRIFLQGSVLVLEGNSIARYLEKANAVAIFACTLGAKSEQLIRELSITDPTDALIFDACCSAYIEATAEDVEKEIVEWATEQGFTTTKRYSPGFGDFPLEIQPTLLRAIKAEKMLGLTVNEENLMIPTKSITAVIGLIADQNTCLSPQV